MLDSPETQEMSFMDHLEALRKHIVRSVIAIVVLSFVAGYFMDFIFDEILLAPVQADFWTYRMLCKVDPSLCFEKLDFHLQNRTVAGQFTMFITASIVSGLILAFPYVFWQLWSFIKPGLHPRERKSTSGAVVFVTVLFTFGVLFGYYIVAPTSLNFLIHFKIGQTGIVTNIFDLSSYISFMCLLIVGTGLMFQLPVVIYILSKMGLVGPAFLRKYRKHAIVIIFIAAAILTPSPDLMTQAIVALPLLLLYEISIFISAGVAKRKTEDMLDRVGE